MAEPEQTQGGDIVEVEPPENMEPPGAIPPPLVSPPFDIREWVASGIASGLFLLFAFTVAYPVWHGVKYCTLPHEILSFVETAAAHEVILLGIILAFYFSERRHEMRQ